VGEGGARRETVAELGVVRGGCGGAAAVLGDELVSMVVTTLHN
jgi:hypothetical protein